MPHYVDIGAQRVQSWLTATPRLDHLRGASHALAALTAEEAISAWLTTSHPEVQVCAEAGEKDGVVTLECPTAQSAATAASALVRHLMHELPRVVWEGWSTEAASYVEAHTRAVTGSSGVLRYRSFPPLYDTPVLDQCTTCREEARRRLPDGSLDSGPDCHVRLEHREPPRDLLLGLPGAWPPDFQHLARQGGLPPDRTGRQAVGRKDSRNHLALIKADGNRVGAVFEALAAHATDFPALLRSAPADLTTATRTAVYEAARAVTAPGASYKGAIPHYVAGDDVLVTVPAASGWTFVATLIGQFEMLQGTWLDAVRRERPSPALQQRMEELIGRVSLGVGMVMAHETHPLADAFALADSAMEAAKRESQGSYSAVAWVDLTAEGMAGARSPERWLQVVGGFEVRDQLRDAGRADSSLTAAIMSLPPSGRAQLASEIRDTAEGARAAAVANWCDRRPVNVAPIRTAAREGRIEEILALLSRARWWPTASQEESE